MDKEKRKAEIKETAIWLLNIAGFLLIVTGGCIYKSAPMAYTGMSLFTIYMIIRAFQHRSNKKALRSYLIGITVLALLVIYSLIR